MIQNLGTLIDCLYFHLKMVTICWWSFDNDIATNVIMFGVDKSSPYPADNLKSNFLLLGKGPTFGINGVHQKKSSILFLLKKIQNFVSKILFEFALRC